MPVYDYQCDDCGHLFEVTRKRSEPDPEKCPKCGAPNPRRAISATSFQLKGTGWYVTDYKGANPSLNTTSAGSDGGGDSATASDSKKSEKSESSSESKDPAPAKREVA